MPRHIQRSPIDGNSPPNEIDVRGSNSTFGRANFTKAHIIPMLKMKRLSVTISFLVIVHSWTIAGSKLVDQNHGSLSRFGMPWV